MYTLKAFAEMFHVSEHTLRYYTDIGLLPCQRDKRNRRIFDEESMDWMQGIQCLKGCGASIEDIRQYCSLCRQPASRETLEARYQIILAQRQKAYLRIEEAKKIASYMDEKVEHYQNILAGTIADDSNPATWTKDTRPEKHDSQ